MPDHAPPQKIGFWFGLRRAMTPPSAGETGGLPQWRERMFFFTLGPGLILGLLAYLMALPVLTRGGHYLVMTLDSGMLALTLILFILRRLTLTIRVAVLLLMIYLIGLALLVTIGPLSSGPFWLFMIPILAALYLGRRPALAGLALNLVTLLVIAWFYYTGQMSWAEDLVNYRDQWAIIVANFIFINAATALPVAIMVGGLETSLERQRSVAQELAKERARLNQEVAGRRQAQEAQAKSEQLYRLVADNVGDSIWIVRLAEMALTYVSPSVQAILGYSPQEAMSLGLQGLLTPQSLARIQRLLAQETRQDPTHPDPNRSRIVVVEGVKADGDKLWLEVSGRFLRDPGGKPEALLGIARDVTERRRSEEALRLSEQRYRDLFDSITDLIYTQDLEGHFLSANQATAAIFGYQPEELIGRPGSEFMLPEHREAFKTEYLPTLSRIGFMAGLSQYLDSRGEKHYIEYRSTLVRPEKGEPYISGSGRDVTDRIEARRRLKQLEAQLLQSQKMEAMGTLAGGIAHDFNNVLASMLGFTELVLTDLPSESPWRHNLEQVLKAGERAKGMVRQILSFSRQSESSRRPVAVQPVVVEALELLRASLPATITVASHLDAPREMVMADPSQVHQVMMNLATNAFQAMGSGGGVLNVILEPVELGSEQAAAFAELEPGPYLRLTVSDTGPGMDPQTMQRIFEPFFTTKDKSEGSGMGLAMVHSIVKNHGGEVTVQSRPGRGSMFEVYLPRLANAPESLPKSQANQRSIGGSERVLLVDDEEPVGEMGRSMLERLGYRVSLCRSGRNALDVVRAAPQGYDLVITDLTMPHLSGDELARRINEIAPELPVVIATGYGGHLSREGLPPNVRLILSKPFSSREMSHAVRRALKPAGSGGRQEG
ncbi:MAG: PAS domain S-box protein [Desulfarculaceae bacterium]|nr:PAS domain S-box protein [Desulfarculaceae bacterium]MCF8097117.1 PAS domain S-box protein [Desulfarculaceae bacterium]MCF8122696.1 PAS domain S-box protein [Desulfarculaceae bacterium]